MKLSQYAAYIRKEADLRGYAADRSRAADPLIRPFALFQDQQERRLDLQRSTLILCWLNDQRKLIPYDKTSFDAIQSEISRLQEIITSNNDVLTELEAAVEDMHIDQMSLGILRMERSKALEEISFLKSEPDKALAHKWKAIQEIHGSREMYEALPEVIAARQQAAVAIAPIQARIEILEHQIHTLESILSEFRGG